MTLEVCNTMANIGKNDIEFNFQDMVPDPETEMATKHLEEMNNSLFSGNISEDSITVGAEDCFTILQSMDTNQNELNFFPVDVQNCIEVESTNLTTISDNQIVEIQFLVNNDLEDASVTSDILSMETPINEDVTSYEIFDNEVSTNTEVLYTATEPNIIEPSVETPLKMVNPLNISVLSPQSESDEQNERDLTSLNWLHNITNIMAVPNLPTPPVSPPPKPQKKKVSSSQEDLTININFYKKNGDKKPPFSYATLICMAMGKNGNKMTLSAIYHWIKENFLYYRKAHPSWQVSSFKSIFWAAFLTLPFYVIYKNYKNKC